MTEYWAFDSEATLSKLRLRAYQNFMREHGPRMKEPYFWTAQSQSQFGQTKKNFLTVEEDRLFVRHHEGLLLGQYRRFEPAMSTAVIGTAFHLYKRFFLKATAMELPPMDIIITSIYLASKIEGKSVRMYEFGQNFENGDRAVSVALALEPVLKQKLDNQLEVLNPFDCAKYLFRDIKMREAVANAEYLWPCATQFLKKSLLTDALFMYTPMQIAVASLLDAASMCRTDLTKYIKGVFLKDSPEKLASYTIASYEVRQMVNGYKPPNEATIKQIRLKFQKIWDPSTNERSKKYEDNLSKIVDDLREKKPWMLDGAIEPPTKSAPSR